MALGRPAKQSKVIPEDGYVTFHVGPIRASLEEFMQYQEPDVSLGIAIRELIQIALATNPLDAGIMLSRRKALTESRQYVYRRLSQVFSELESDLQNTAVQLESQDEYD